VYKSGSETETKTEYRDLTKVKIKYRDYKEKKRTVWGNIMTQDSSTITLNGRHWFAQWKKSVEIPRSDIIWVGEFNKGKAVGNSLLAFLGFLVWAAAVSACSYAGC